jgi:shikimate kinase
MNHSQIHVPRTVVLVGMMGVGKTSIGRQLAKRLQVLFKDSDHEVEAAAGCSISEIYDWYGEQAFIDTERRVIHRLMDEAPHVLSTGVGAFITSENRDIIKRKGFSVWLDASYATLLSRVERRTHRPQLERGDKKMTLQSYIEQYYPTYAEADYHVNCDQQSPDKTVDFIIHELKRQF